MTKKTLMKELGKEGCIELYRIMVRIREFEEKIR
jgi:TPP-dependent pyruvate/acetoin dehydrogenase alpha subunit